MKNTVIFHRNDFDGIFCREIARKFLPDAELIGWHYGDPLVPMPVEGTVYILDLSPECLDVNQPELAADKTFIERIIWIDHHASAIEKYAAVALPGYRIDGVSACRLAWQWFQAAADDLRHHADLMPPKQDFIGRNVSEPIAVRLAGEYDVWDKRDPNAELFQHGLRSRELTPEQWDLLLTSPFPSDAKCLGAATLVSNLLNDGQVVQFVKTQENAGIIKNFGYDICFEDIIFLACNHAQFNSQLFTAGLQSHHRACFGFKWTGKGWEISLYHAPGHEDIDLSIIAKKYGGGGHKGACGFRLTTTQMQEFGII